MDRSKEFAGGWTVLLGAFTGVAGSYGSLYFYSAGLFIKPLTVEFGWSRGAASLGSLATVVGVVAAMPIAGRLVDRFGERRIALLSGIGLGLSFAALGLLTVGLASWLALALLLSIVSAGCNPISYNRAVIRSFHRHRGLALGLTLMGIGIGAAVVPSLLTPWIAQHGWRSGYVMLGAAALLLATIATLLLRNQGPTHLAGPTAGNGPRKLQTRPLFTIGALIFLASLAVFGTTMHLVPMLTDRGMDAATAGAAAALLGVAVIFSRAVTGFLLDRWDAGWVTTALLGLASGGALLLWSGEPAAVLPACLLIGLGVGTESDLLAYLVGRRFGVANFGTAYGLLFAVHAFAAGLGGFLAGLLFDIGGSYGAWLLLAAAALAGAALIALATERGPREPATPEAEDRLDQQVFPV